MMSLGQRPNTGPVWTTRQAPAVRWHLPAHNSGGSVDGTVESVTHGRHGAVAVAIAATMMASSCGRSTSTTSVFATAESQLSSARTFRVHIDSHSESPLAASVGDAKASGDGLVDYASHRAHLTFMVGADSKSSDEVIFDGSATYLRLNVPALGTGAKPWQKFSGPGSPDQSSSLFPLGDPTTALQYLHNKATHVSTVGHEDVRGVPTTHYRAVFAHGSVAAALPTEGPFDAWIDGQGRLRRLGLTVVTTVPAPTPAQFTSISTMDLYDFGVAVNIPLPPPSQVLEFDSAKPMEGITPNGPWTKTAAGTTAGIGWEIFTASGGPNELCVSVSTSPDLGGIAIQRTVQGASQFRPLRSEGFQYRGRPTNCVADPAAGSVGFLSIEPLELVDADSAHQRGPGLHDFAALVDPRSTDIVALFSDGSTQALTPLANVVFYAWRGDREVEHIELTPPKPWGGRMRCGGGNDGGILRDPAGASCYNDKVQTP